MRDNDDYPEPRTRRDGIEELLSGNYNITKDDLSMIQEILEEKERQEYSDVDGLLMRDEIKSFVENQE